MICEVTNLKRGLERMLKFSDKEREEMGTRGREWMKEEFSCVAEPFGEFRAGGGGVARGGKAGVDHCWYSVGKGAERD